MEILFFNAWYGRLEKDVRAFIRDRRETTDVFCFQEADREFQMSVRDLLEDYRLLTASKVTSNDHFDQATYVSRRLQVVDKAEILQEVEGVGLGIYTGVSDGERVWHIGNVHGMSKPGDKLDTDLRMEQSRVLLNVFGEFDGPRIIGGDFNLDFGSKSVGMFSEEGYRNLVTADDCTRNRYVWERYPDSKQYHSDYVFVSGEVRVRDFRVLHPKPEVSDHEPMTLEVE